MIRVGVIGASGHAGTYLLRMLLALNSIRVELITSTTLVGKRVSEEIPDLTSDLSFEAIDFQKLNALDVVFISVPHGKSKEIAPYLKDCKVIDLSADYRATKTYGLPEIFYEEIKSSSFVANPGCYATSCLLAAYPIRDLISHVIFDCISGYSGAGKNAKDKFDYEQNILAYNLVNHFHRHEISKTLGAHCKVSFTPHVTDVFSGIICTAHIILKEPTALPAIKKCYQNFYSNNPYKNSQVTVIDGIPSSKDVVHSGKSIVGGMEIDEHGVLVVISVIDNLMKGAAYQAIENLKIMFDLD
ncbi:MAG: N-acetyl-gamma-glutamyl-phosphate reductase [Oligoflexia bacterium]|nr:N-acetyl-gamma-glutamyl-phosphate reductase [Oligoflexia bacterium]